MTSNSSQSRKSRCCRVSVTAQHQLPSSLSGPLVLGMPSTPEVGQFLYMSGLRRNAFTQHRQKTRLACASFLVALIVGPHLMAEPADATLGHGERLAPNDGRGSSGQPGIIDGKTRLVVSMRTGGDLPVNAEVRRSERQHLTATTSGPSDMRDPLPVLYARTREEVVLEVDARTAKEVKYRLTGDPLVESVEYDQVFSVAAAPRAGSSIKHLTAGTLGGQPQSRFGSNGAVVAVIDTGVSENLQLKGRVLAGRDVVLGTNDARDVSRHGTSVATTIAGNGHNGALGTCPRCLILPVRVLDADGKGWGSDIAAGIRWAAERGVQVINLSIEGPFPSNSVHEALLYARSRNISVVAAAGNSASPYRHHPAGYDEVVSVAAALTTSIQASRASWSNYGHDWVSVAAPACAITAGVSGAILQSCGTSFSAPQVSGLIAQTMTTTSILDPVVIEDAVFKTARPNDFTRYGLVSTEALDYLEVRHDGGIEPIAPVRVLDTRPGDHVVEQRLEIPLRAVLDADASTQRAVVLNLTASGARAAGYLTVWNCDEPMPTTSNLNFIARRTRANITVVGVSRTGSVCVSSSAATHLVVDAIGKSSNGTEEVTALPQRVMDTRGDVPFEPGETRRIKAPNVPRGGAVLVNATMAGAHDDGFISVFPCWNITQWPPETSTLNYRTGDTVAAASVVVLSNRGFCVYSQAGGDVVLDLLAHLPNVAPASKRRVFDTRDGGEALDAHTVREVVVPIPLNLAPSGVFITATAVDPAEEGFVSVVPCGRSTRITTSTANFSSGSAVANAMPAPTDSASPVSIPTRVGMPAVATAETGATRPIRAVLYPKYSTARPPIIATPEQNPISRSRTVAGGHWTAATPTASRADTATAVRVTDSADDSRPARAANRSEVPNRTAATSANATATAPSVGPLRLAKT
jgi:hypothetical protein